MGEAVLPYEFGEVARGIQVGSLVRQVYENVKRFGIEALEQVADDIRQVESALAWVKLGAVGALLEDIEDEVQGKRLAAEIAQRLDIPEGRVLQLLKVWKTFAPEGFNFSLTVAHHVAAAYSPDPVGYLQLAADEGLSVPELRAIVAADKETSRPKTKARVSEVGEEKQREGEEVEVEVLGPEVPAERDWSSPKPVVAVSPPRQVEEVEEAVAYRLASRMRAEEFCLAFLRAGVQFYGEQDFFEALAIVAEAHFPDLPFELLALLATVQEEKQVEKEQAALRRWLVWVAQGSVQRALQRVFLMNRGLFQWAWG